MEFNGIIYCYTNKTNNKKYIGQTTEKNYKRRHNQHKDGSRHACPKFSNAIKGYGYDNFELTILESGIANIEILNEREMYWIEALDSFGKNGYNLTKGGGGCLGRKRSAESIAKQSGANSCMYGKPKSETTKKLLSEAGKKRVGSLNAFHGKHHTEETRKFISENNKGTFAGKESRVKSPVVCIEVNRFFYTTTEAAKWAGSSSHSNLTNVCTGNSKFSTVGGYSWRYATEDEIAQVDSGVHQFNQEAKAKKYKHKNAKALVCIETGEFFRSMFDTYKKYPVADPNKYTFSGVVGKENRRFAGLHWRYATPEEVEIYDTNN